MPPLSSVLVDLLIPPTGLALLALVALLLPGRLARFGRGLALVAVVLLVALALSPVSRPLLASLTPPATDVPAGPPPQAIVILSGDTDRVGADGQVDIGALTLERERAGAALARRTGLPVLVTGGLVNGPPPVAQLMATSLQQDFNVPVRWVEDRSRTTWENAQFSAELLRAAGIGRIYLVTHAWHMRRSLLAFRQAGLDPVAAPVRIEADRPALGTAYDWVPRTTNWLRAFFAVHEWVGMLFYSVRG